MRSSRKRGMTGRLAWRGGRRSRRARGGACVGGCGIAQEEWAPPRVDLTSRSHTVYVLQTEI
eukprot:6196772-Pleurochrysis_carterae.AAC.1